MLLNIIGTVTINNDLFLTLRMNGAKTSVHHTHLQPTTDQFALTIVYVSSISVNCKCPWKAIICNGSAVATLCVELQIEEESAKHSVFELFTVIPQL